jgi:hypothetical protein
MNNFTESSYLKDILLLIKEYIQVFLHITIHKLQLQKNIRQVSISSRLGQANHGQDSKLPLKIQIILTFVNLC